MNDKNRIDSHKLIFHPQRVSDFLKGKHILPINMEICLIGACNHRCVFCTVDYLDYKPIMISYDLLMNNLDEVCALNDSNGIKSILLAGTGEPLLYPQFSDVVKGLKNRQIDVALSTNGVLFTPNVADENESDLSWIRFSVSGGTEETYKRIHRGKEGDLQRVFDNIAYAAMLKKRKHLSTVLNVQIVMVPENYKEIIPLAKKVKELGADNFIVKVCGTSVNTLNSISSDIDINAYEDLDNVRKNLEALSNENFGAIFRDERLNNIINKKAYGECYASPFHAFLQSDGTVYPCCQFVGIERYAFGDIHEMSLKDIFFDKMGRRLEVLKILKDEKLCKCPNACKLDVMNKYVNELKNPGEHVNFI